MWCYFTQKNLFVCFFIKIEKPSAQDEPTLSLSPLVVLFLWGSEAASLRGKCRRSRSTACCLAAWRPGSQQRRLATQSGRTKGWRRSPRWRAFSWWKRRAEAGGGPPAGSHCENWWSAVGTDGKPVREKHTAVGEVTLLGLFWDFAPFLPGGSDQSSSRVWSWPETGGWLETSPWTRACYVLCWAPAGGKKFRDVNKIIWRQGCCTDL